jgi:hypothetical protein
MSQALAYNFTSQVDETADALLEGVALGTIDRRYGLVSCSETVRVAQAIARSGDLAVADRHAFIVASRMHTGVLVVEADGWYHIVVADRYLDFEQTLAMSALTGSPRLMSFVSERGIAPIVSPLVH